MPPKKKKSSQVKEDVNRQRKLLSVKEKIIAKKRFLLGVIEKMIEDDVNKDWFLNYCTYLCPDDLNDVVEERYIGNLCGYPLCSNPIKKVIKQQFNISNRNRLFDLTERKRFCSNVCYKASNYVRVQLSSIPFHMREEENIKQIKLNLLPCSDNKGSEGEEIKFYHKIPKDEINKVYHEESSVNLTDLLNAEIQKCADSLNDLQIKEHVFKKQYVFSDETTTQNKSDNSDSDSDDSIDEKFFPCYDNEKALFNRHMPVPQKIKKSVLIPPQKFDVKSISQANELSLNFTRKVFKDWMTEDTLKYLLGEKYVYQFKADHLFNTMTESQLLSSEKLASVKEKYIELCLKIDSLPDDDIFGSFEILIGKSNSKKIETENISSKKFLRRPKGSKDKNKHVTFAPTLLEKKEESSKSEKDETSSIEKVKIDIEFKNREIVEPLTEKQMQSQTNNNASLNVDGNMSSTEKLNNNNVEEKTVQSTKILNENQDPVKKDETVLSSKDKAEKETVSDIQEPEITFPLVDSDVTSQNILRKQVLIKNLKSVYAELLPVAGLHYTDIRENVTVFIETLSLTPSNIMYKPKEWKLISLVLFRMLTRTVLKDLHDELQFAKLCEDPLMPITVDIREIENLVCQLISTDNISTD